MNRQKVLLLVAGALFLAVVVKYGVTGREETPVVAAEESVPAAELRLDRVRRLAATLPGREELYRKAQKELAEQEKGLLKAVTQQQAQVELLQKVQDVARANQIEIRGSQAFQQRALNADYAEVSVTVTFSCGMEQLVNFLAALGNQPETLATDQIHISGGSDKKKNVQVRLAVAALVPRKVIPEKKGAAGF